MTFKSALWFPAALVLAAINLVGVGMAVVPGEALHAATHAGLAVGFGFWAQHLRRRRNTSDTSARLDGLESGMERLETLENEMARLQQDLNETQERLDFAERLLAQQRAEPGQVGQPGPPKPTA